MIGYDNGGVDLDVVRGVCCHVLFVAMITESMYSSVVSLIMVLGTAGWIREERSTWRRALVMNVRGGRSTEATRPNFLLGTLFLTKIVISLLNYSASRHSGRGD